MVATSHCGLLWKAALSRSLSGERKSEFGWVRAAALERSNFLVEDLWCAKSPMLRRCLYFENETDQILHLLGINHEKLTFKFRGRDFRLTDVGGELIGDLLA